MNKGPSVQGKAFVKCNMQGAPEDIKYQEIIGQNERNNEVAPIDISNYTIDENLVVNYSELKNCLKQIKAGSATQDHVNYAASCLNKHHVKLEEFISILRTVDWNMKECFKILKTREELRRVKQYLQEKADNLQKNLKQNGNYMADMALQAKHLFNQLERVEDV